MNLSMQIKHLLLLHDNLSSFFGSGVCIIDINTVVMTTEDEILIDSNIFDREKALSQMQSLIDDI